LHHLGSFHEAFKTMSILNTANDGYFNVLIVVCRALNELGSVELDDLLNLCGPNGLIDETKRVRETITRWTQLGLIVKDSGTFSLAEKLSKKTSPTEGVEFLNHLRRRCRRVVLEEANNARFWDAEASRSADFTRGVTWLVAQDVYTFPQTGNSEVMALESEQIAEAGKRILQNELRWNGLRSWATFLGFGWVSPKFFVIDPTVAVRDSLSEVFSTEKELTAEIFVERLSHSLPVLDGGTYRRKLEDVLDETSWQRPRSGQISTSLSRALRRLQSSGELIFDPRADAVGLAFTGRGGEEWGRFTHVKLGKGRS
jgi:hypothetical protein